MESLRIDLLSVFIAAALYMVINFFWYSKWVFGEIWLRLSGLSAESMKSNKMAMVWGFLVALVIAYFIAFFEAALGVTTILDGMFVGFCLWAGFIATTQLSAVIWCNRSFQLFAIDTGAKLVSILAMSGVIGA